MSKIELVNDMVLETNSLTSQDNRQKVRNWIDEQDLDDLESVPESSVVDSSDNEYDNNSYYGEDSVTTTELGTIGSTELSTITESLQELLNNINSVQTVGNVSIENSTGVHIGNITNINGNIQIIHASNANSGRSFRTKDRSKMRDRKPNSSAFAPSYHEETRESLSSVRPQPGEIETEERHCKDAFIGKIKIKLPQKAFAILPRRTWLAQRPLEDYELLPEPVEYVIISHTATESSEKQAINIRTIRDIQCFHIESREWNDIAYNFLVGCDANIYEGRGWGVKGAHTLGYNACSLGFSFVGCFMRELPPPPALNACKFLLKKGVEEGHIASNYKLLCHCQCSPTESPGRRLYEEIQTWEHFYRAEE